jgi:hypothetical protein
MEFQVEPGDAQFRILVAVDSLQDFPALVFAEVGPEFLDIFDAPDVGNQSVVIQEVIQVELDEVIAQRIEVTNELAVEVKNDVHNEIPFS